MTTMDTEPGFDTLAHAQRLKAAGVEDKQAEAHAAAARDSQAGLATKADLANLEALLRGEMAALEARLRGDMAALEARLYKAMGVQTVAIAGIVVAIVKLL